MKRLLMVGLLSLFWMNTPVSAEEATDAAKTQRREMRQELMQKREALRDQKKQARETRQELRQETREMKQGVREERKALRQERQTLRENARAKHRAESGNTAATPPN